MNLRQIAATAHPIHNPNDVPAAPCWDEGRINGVAWRTCLAVMLLPPRAGGQPAWHWMASAIHLRGNGRPVRREKYTRAMLEKAGRVARELIGDAGAGTPRLLAAPAGVIVARAMTPEEIARVAPAIVEVTT